MASNMFEQYYANQVIRGGGNVFKGGYYQRGYGLRQVQHGYGIGGIFKGLLCTASPFITEAVKIFGKRSIVIRCRIIR